MKIVHADYKILTDLKNLDILKHLERIARVCYKSEDKITKDDQSAKDLLTFLIQHHHEAMLEHESISVLFTVDRGVTHEMVRHRMASFAQESTRYCNYSNDKFGNEITVVVPPFLHQHGAGYEIWLETMAACEDAYLGMLKYGYSPQQARSVLPNSLKAEIVITANIREWRHILTLRTSIAAHPQMREVMVPLLGEFKRKIPVLFDDIVC